MIHSTEWLRGRHRRVLRGLRVYFGIQICFSVGVALVLTVIEQRPIAWLSLITGAGVGLLLLPIARRVLKWLYIPVLLMMDIVHVTALLWSVPVATLQRGSLWALAYIPVLVAAGRWWSYTGGSIALGFMLAADALVLFGRLTWRVALPVFTFQAVTAALGMWAAAHSESRTRRDIIHQEALQLSEQRTIKTAAAYEATFASIDAIKHQLQTVNANGHQPELDHAINELQTVRQTLHRTLRAVGGLKLGERTLPEAIAIELRQFRLETGMNVRFNLDGHLPATRPIVTEFLWRVVQEALSNIRDHAQATSLTLELYGQHDQVILQICDDGVGFDPATLNGHDGYQSLNALSALANDVHCTLEIISTPQEGTTLQAIAPALQLRKV